MKLSNVSTEKYHISIRILHWLMALLILTMIAVGWKMTGIAKDDPQRMFIYNLHKSVGATLLGLVVLRIVLRLANGAPALPQGIPSTVRLLARTGQKILYVLMFAVPFSGYFMSNLFGYAVSWFGFFDLPKFVSEANPELGKQVKELHEIFAYTLLAVVIIHIIGALQHRYFDKNKDNDVIKTMI
jgi:cytochrome b561